MNRLWGLVLGALLAAVLAAACGGGKSVTVKGPNGENVKVSGSNSKLPSDFPSDFPVYKGADYQGGVQANEKGVNGFFATWQTGDSVDKVKSYYDDQFKNGAWTTTGTFNSGGANTWAVQKKDDTTMVGYVSVIDAGGKTQITAGVGKNPDTNASSGGGATEQPSSASGQDTPESSSGNDTPSANSALPAEVALPSDYPKDRVPLPDGARVTSASSVSSNGQKSYVLEFYTKDDAQTVIDGFKSELPKHNWTETLTTNSGGTSLGTWTNGDESVTVTTETSDVSGYTKVSMLVAVKAS